ncbi:MAG: hypothetical protein ACT4O0_15890 [Pseudonocardia sp.]
MVEIPVFNYDAFSLETKFGWMQAGAGPDSAFVGGDRLRKIADRLTASDRIIGQNMLRRKLGTGWEGTAAAQAGAALNRTADTISAAARAGGSAGGALRGYGDSFVTVRNTIPPPVVIGQNSVLGEMADGLGQALKADVQTDFGIQSDYTRRLAAHAAADAAANQALKAHEEATRQSLTVYASAMPGAGAPGPAAPGGGADGVLDGGADGVLGGGVGGRGSATPDGAGGAGGGTSGAAAGAGAAGGGGMGGSSGGIGGSGGGVGVGSGGGAGAGDGDGWTPAGTDSASAGPPGLAPGENGGFVPAANALGQHVPPPIALPPTGAEPRGRGPGSAGGYRAAGAGPASGGGGGAGASLAARGGAASAGAGLGSIGGSGPVAGPGGVGRGGPGGMGLPPMGMGGGAGGQDREHRNQSYVPSDEPFRATDQPDQHGFVATAPVLGVPDAGGGQAPAWERW